MSEGGPTAIEEALRIHPTWINGGRDLPGPGGSIIAAAMAVASGPLPPRAVLPHRVGVHVRRADGRAAGWCGETAAAPRADGSPARSGMARALRRHVGRELDRHERQPVHAPLRRPPRDARADRRQRPRRTPREPGRHLPGADDHGRLPRGPPHHLAVRSLRLRRALRRVDRGDRFRGVGRRRPPPAGGADRGGRHADPRAGVVGPGHPDPRAPGPGAVRAPVDPTDCGRPTWTSRWSTTASPSTPSPGSRASGSAASARPATGSTAGGASPSTASCRSTRTAGSSPKGGHHGFGFVYEAVLQLRHDAGERQVPRRGRPW